MGTTYNVKFLPTEQQPVNDMQREIDSILDAVNMSMSTYLPESELSRINATARGVPIQLSDDLAIVLAQALEISWYTDGAYDMTAGPLVNLWGFGPDKHPGTIPELSIIQRTLRLTGPDQVILTMGPFTLTKLQDNVYLDLSGIAKGYAVDQLAAWLEARGITHYLVEIGGEIKASGTNAKGLAWRIGIEQPVTDVRLVQRIIGLDNLAMATSGDYRNYFEQDGKRYSHVINPKTGYPVSHNLVSVTVLDRSTTWADAMATALLVMGPEAGPRFANQQQIQAMFILRNNDNYRELYSSGFEANLVE